jgi:hypothetical protein
MCISACQPFSEQENTAFLAKRHEADRLNAYLQSIHHQKLCFQQFL